MSDTMQTLSRSSLREQAIEAIRAGIITGEIGAGELYSAPTLAARLGVSATPVREAMLELANEGLVVAERNRGFRIVELSDHDLDEILELRLMLEVPATRRVAEQATPEDVATMRRQAAVYRQFVAKSNLPAALESDRRFHLGFLEILGNRRLVDIVAQLRAHSRLDAWGQCADSKMLDATVAEHNEIVEAIAAGDGAAAERVMRRHIRHTRGLWAGRPEDGASGTPA